MSVDEIGWRRHYGSFYDAAGDALHLLAHSHHPWPDVSRAAQQAYWDDSVRLAGRKWAKIDAEVLPEAQHHVARLLNIEAPERIAFAPNTHELVARLYSSLDWSRPVRVLTTDREFHSFARQTRRLEETGWLQVMRVPVEPYVGFHARFAAALGDQPDFIYLSQVFYDSGFVVAGLADLVMQAPRAALFCIDGYHAFNALPVDLSALSERVYYLAGGYKYAQAGEGACFLTLPRDCTLRPLYTGWFAQPPGDDSADGPVRYAEHGQRFSGATFDASGLYRFNAVMRWLEQDGITPAVIHAHATRLQADFLDGLADLNAAALPVAALTPPLGLPRGNFCSFDLPHATRLEAQLLAHKVLVDRRGERLRFGFGLYQDSSFMNRLLARLRLALR